MSALSKGLPELIDDIIRWQEQLQRQHKNSKQTKIVDFLKQASLHAI